METLEEWRGKTQTPQQNEPVRGWRRAAATLADGYYLARQRLGAGPQEYIFVLGHMRSGSSLLTHLLAENAEICGYGETHLAYETPDDLRRLACKVYRRLRRMRMPERFVLDKILHDRLSIDPSILAAESCRFVFLIRRPTPSIASMLRAYPDWFSGATRPPEVVIAKAADYYVRRLDRLADYAARIGCRRRMLLLTHDTLIDGTAAALSTLQEFLELRNPLRAEYRLLRTTGQRGAGDFSKNIRAGRIVRRPAEAAPDLPEDLLARLDDAYRTARQRLTSLCRVVDESSDDTPVVGHAASETDALLSEPNVRT